MLAALNAASERAAVWPIDARDRELISALNECRVRDHLGLEQVPTF